MLSSQLFYYEKNIIESIKQYIEGTLDETLYERRFLKTEKVVDLDEKDAFDM